MVELLGRQYVLDFCLSELSAKNQEKAYRIYVTDVLKLLTEGFYSSNGGTIKLDRMYDIVYANHENAENRTEKEIIEDIKRKFMMGGEN